jgi:hypothetical protein
MIPLALIVNHTASRPRDPCRLLSEDQPLLSDAGERR